MFTLVSDHISVKIDTHITKLVVKMISCFLIEMQKETYNTDDGQYRDKDRCDDFIHIYDCWNHLHIVL